jgi:hypothetical protein
MQHGTGKDGEGMAARPSKPCGSVAPPLLKSILITEKDGGFDTKKPDCLTLVALRG